MGKRYRADDEFVWVYVPVAVNQDVEEETRFQPGGGFPGGPGGFPGGPGGFPGGPGGFPGGPGGFPGGPGGFPGGPGGFPGGPGGFPGGPGGFPGGPGAPGGVGRPPGFTPSYQQAQKLGAPGVPGVSPYAVAPQTLRRCINRWTYIWQRNGNQFWIFLTDVRRRTATGLLYGYYPFGIDVRTIDAFYCV